MKMQVPRQDYTICALDLGKKQPSHAFELIFPEGFHVTSLFTEQVLNTFKLLPIAMDQSCISKSIYFRKKVDPAAHHDSAMQYLKLHWTQNTIPAIQDGTDGWCGEHQRSML